MKTTLTLPGRPTDIIARWTLLEERISGEHEEHCLAILRHVLLGCSVCRDEEVMEYLVGWPRKLCTMREALAAIDFLAAQYLFSERGRREMLLLRGGAVPALLHTEGGPSRDDGFRHESGIQNPVLEGAEDGRPDEPGPDAARRSDAARPAGR